MEINGWGHSFYNNEVTYNAGGGMAINLMGAVCPLGYPFCCPPPSYGPRSPKCMEGHLAITSNNPWYADDSPKLVEQNTYNGITVYGPPDNFNSFQGVTLDNILVRANAGWGVYLEGVSADSIYNGFINGACLYPSPDSNRNTGGTAQSTPPPAGATSLNLLNSYGSVVTSTQPGYVNWLPNWSAGFLASLQSGVCPVPWPAQAPPAWFPAGWPH